MDLDKIATFISKVGLVPAMLIWLAWELHGFIGKMIVTQEGIVQALNKLVDLHR